LVFFKTLLLVELKNYINMIYVVFYFCSGYSVQAQCVSSKDTVAATTNTVAVIPTAGGAVSLGAPNTLSRVTPTTTTLMGVALNAPSPAVMTPTTNVGLPNVTEIGIITPFSNYTLSLLPATVSPSPTSVVTSTTNPACNTVTSTVSCTSSKAVQDSASAGSEEMSSTFLASKDDIPNASLIIEESSTNTDVTVCPPTPVSAVAASNITRNNVTKGNRRHVCQYCNKPFPENIIDHHRKLHFKKRFFSCITCGKNFRTEVGLDHHRCVNCAD
jgi:DNA-directed RNA polymerase subunit RPC12/RpoP